MLHHAPLFDCHAVPALSWNKLDGEAGALQLFDKQRCDVFQLLVEIDESKEMAISGGGFDAEPLPAAFCFVKAPVCNAIIDGFYRRKVTPRDMDALFFDAMQGSLEKTDAVLVRRNQR